jgi:hypothetical protein
VRPRLYPAAYQGVNPLVIQPINVFVHVSWISTQPRAIAEPAGHLELGVSTSGTVDAITLGLFAIAHHAPGIDHALGIRAKNARISEL